MAKEKKSFESMLVELEQVVATMEQGDLPLDEMVKQYSAGVKLAAACQKKLQAAADVLTEQERQE